MCHFSLGLDALVTEAQSHYERWGDHFLSPLSPLIFPPFPSPPSLPFHSPSSFLLLFPVRSTLLPFTSFPLVQWRRSGHLGCPVQATSLPPSILLSSLPSRGLPRGSGQSPLTQNCSVLYYVPPFYTVILITTHTMSSSYTCTVCFELSVPRHKVSWFLFDKCCRWTDRQTDRQMPAGDVSCCLIAVQLTTGHCRLLGLGYLASILLCKHWKFGGEKLTTVAEIWNFSHGGYM